MRIERWMLAGLIALIWPYQAARAVDISVAPGDGTLAAAVASAADGDRLLLEEGTFTGDVTLDRSLILRPVNRATDAVVAGGVTISGDGIAVTVQNLIFTTQLTVDQAAAVRLLENTWTAGNIRVSAYRSSQGDGSLVIVGNQLVSGSIYDVLSENAYIAGNRLLSGRIEGGSSVWIVGNEISFANAIDITNTAATARIIGNRLRCSYVFNSVCVDSGATYNLISANVVEIEQAGDDGNLYGINAFGNGQSILMNNVVRGIGLSGDGLPIRVSSPSARVSGNIVIDYSTASSPLIEVSSAIADVTHNLCFNSSGDCPAGDGNLSGVDPQFVDLVDYQLAAGSPAIDAGPPDYGLADLDRSRNDMGAQGGPWSIGQYDNQRDPDSLAPFVYPLFRADSSIFDGNLEVEALGVARLR